MPGLRLKNLAEIIRKKGWGAFLVCSPANVGYLSGFNGEGLLFVTPKDVHLITDGRYSLRAKQETRGINIEVITPGGDFSKKVAQLLKKLRVKQLGFEPRAVSYQAFKKLKALKNLELKPGIQLVEGLRAIKDNLELSALRKAAEITTSAFEHAFNIVRPGMRENKLVAEIEYFFRQKGARCSFEPIVASGARTAFPHPELSCGKILPNTLLLIDLGAQYQGYNCDLTRVIFLGKISAKLKQIYKITLQAQKRAIQAVRPGVKIFRLDQIARQYIKRKIGGDFFTHASGHGVGREVHELPYIFSKSKGTVKRNMVFTLEPGIYLPGYAGVRLEDTVLASDKGVEVLTSLPKYFAK